QPSKPFRSDHAEQIKLVSSFDWIDFAALRGIDEELREIMAGSAFIDEARLDSLCYALRKRVELLSDFRK
ncbi:MAG: excisionase, partial [Clostridiales Family XIII bacterium]|nr:excisionase [Clostridiales Family XIII bacterium]